MRIAICGSMVFTEKMRETKRKLEEMGHIAFVSAFADAYVGKNEKEKLELTLYHKYEKDAIREFWEKIKQSDAIVVLNYDRHSISNYIGGNTFLEIGFAYVLGKKIYLMNPIPDIPYYRAEIESMRPIILNGDLTAIQ